MNTQTQDLTLTCTRTIPAAPEAVFDAWLNPATIAKFMTPGPGMSVPKAETDARVGGRFDIVMKAGDQEIPHWGLYRELDRPNRIVFTWNSPFTTDEDSTVTLTFAPADGGTDVTLHHVRFPSEESRDNHEGGWTHILATLEDALA